MVSDAEIPTLKTYLPELMAFVSGLARAYRSGDLVSWDALGERTRAFFTPQRFDQVEAVVPGWREMSSYAGGLTLVHTVCTLIGLLISPEYQRASLAQQEQMHWIVLLHDLGKWVRAGERDRAHPFRSAAQAGAILPRLGFPVTDEYARGFEAWSALVRAGVLVRQESGKVNYIPDNRYLRPIMEGIERLYGHNTPVALIVQAILLHTSITNLHEWPQAAPLTEAEEKRYLTRALLPLLKMMMLADNDGWVLFDAPTSEAYRQETLDVFDRLEAILAACPRGRGVAQT